MIQCENVRTENILIFSHFTSNNKKQPKKIPIASKRTPCLLLTKKYSHNITLDRISTSICTIESFNITQVIDYQFLKT